MVYLGTKGTTAAQMAQEFSVGKPEEIHSDFQTLLSEINSSNLACILKTANRIYGKKTYPFHKKYVEDVKTYFGAEPQSVNFMGASNQIRKEINSWAEKQTEGKILNILPDDAVEPTTRMVLVNALYFKGVWEHQFLVQNATEKSFKINKARPSANSLGGPGASLHRQSVCSRPGQGDTREAQPPPTGQALHGPGHLPEF
ncbi:serpin B10-like [Cervus elaphus]|uniref:serpin B10-like n=1 Tax=Cervus elaphus TaxID=9860 RepID=UPI001CC32274|nr:serpin B10-like [Cervus elaphus]